MRSSPKVPHTAKWLAARTNDDPMSVLRAMRFDTVGHDPLTGEPLNVVEQLNQTFTILVTLRAIEQLFELHPDAGGFRLASGPAAAEIESVKERLVAAEVFSATRPTSNQKLKKDQMRLASDPAEYRTSFSVPATLPVVSRSWKRFQELSLRRRSVAQMCNLYSITTNQAAISALFRVVNRYVGNLAPMPGVFPEYPAPVIRNAGGTEMTMMRWGMPPPPRPGAAGHQHPQHVLTALARLAQAGEPLPCPGQQLRRVRAGAEPGDEEKGRGVVRAQR